MVEDNFDRVVRKSLPEKMQEKVKAVTAKLRKSGLGEPPKDPRARRTASSARSTSSASHSRSASSKGAAGGGRDGKHSPGLNWGVAADVASDAGGGAGADATAGGGGGGGVRRGASVSARAARTLSGSSRSTSSPRRGKSSKQLGPSLNAAAVEQLDELETKLGSSDWKTRDEAVIASEAFAVEHGAGVASGLNKFFDAYGPRLSDSNSKVNLHALEAFKRFLPHIKDAFMLNHAVVVLVVNKLAGNLASKSAGIRQTTSELFAALTSNLEPALLLQPVTAVGDTPST
jgi:hypothetical protein